MVAVGKPRDAAFAAAIREYETRAARYWPLEVVEVREESAKGASPDFVMRKEGERLLARMPAGARLVLCDPGGETFDSAMFAAFLQDQREAARDIVFVLGGAAHTKALPSWVHLGSAVAAVAAHLWAFAAESRAFSENNRLMDDPKAYALNARTVTARRPW